MQVGFRGQSGKAAGGQAARARGAQWAVARVGCNWLGRKGLADHKVWRLHWPLERKTNGSWKRGWLVNRKVVWYLKLAGCCAEKMDGRWKMGLGAYYRSAYAVQAPQ